MWFIFNYQVIAEPACSLGSAGIGEGIAYRPDSILRACVLVLNMLIGILRYDGKAK